MRGPSLLPFEAHLQDKSSLRVSELEAQLGLTISRYFEISGADKEIRGGHGHFHCHQLLRCNSGQVYIKWRNSLSAGEIKLTPSDWLLWVPPRNWISLEFEGQTSVAVLASDPFDERDYFYSPLER